MKGRSGQIRSAREWYERKGLGQDQRGLIHEKNTPIGRLLQKVQHILHEYQTSVCKRIQARLYCYFIHQSLKARGLILIGLARKDGRRPLIICDGSLQARAAPSP